MRNLLSAVSLLACVAVAQPAWAALVLIENPGPAQNNTVDVYFNNNQSTNQVIGRVIPPKGGGFPQQDAYISFTSPVGDPIKNLNNNQNANVKVGDDFRQLVVTPVDNAVSFQGLKFNFSCCNGKTPEGVNRPEPLYVEIEANGQVFRRVIDNGTGTFLLQGQNQDGSLTNEFFRTVTFRGYSDANYSIAADIYQMGQFETRIAATPTAAVPEPATWGMMILGLGLIGGTLRRRSQTTAVRFNFAR